MLEELKHETKQGKAVLISAKAEKPPPHLGLKGQKQEVCYYRQVRVIVPSSALRMKMMLVMPVLWELLTCRRHCL